MCADDASKLPPMIVEEFFGDEIDSKDKRRSKTDVGGSKLTFLLKKHNLLTSLPLKVADETERFRVLENISGYLYELHAQTAVIETNYIDRDYLDDYVRFYSRCFVPYSRRCHRIHFFRKKYSRKSIENVVLRPEPQGLDRNGLAKIDSRFERLKQDYLGFVVIRPLPTAIVGRTCLKPYPDENERYYKAMCDVRVSFFGRELKVRCMPFIQQDAATAVCAGCALWSTFMVTAELFQHRRYCPGCITELATGHGLSEKRSFPNSGLLLRDMAYAIRGVGLEPINLMCEPEIPMDRSHQLGSIYAYLSSGLPVLMTGALRYGTGKVKGEHAIVVNGYHLSSHVQNDSEDRSFLVSDRIDKIYVHDDQVGPSARMINPESAANQGLEWTTGWKDRESEALGGIKFVVHALLIPTYHKIRVNYEMVIRQVEGFEEGIEQVLRIIRRSPDHLKRLPEAAGKSIPKWDVRLLTARDLKREIRQDELSFGRNAKLAILKKNYPRFIWDINLYMEDKRELRFIVDATDSGRNLCVVDVMLYLKRMAKIGVVMSGREWSKEEMKYNPLFVSLIEKIGVQFTPSNSKMPPVPQRPMVRRS